MLRNPVEMLPSWHSELLYETIEDIEDFEAALDAEAERRRGLRIPSHARQSYVESLYYTDVASYAEQVERYLDAFGSANVHVILHEDLRADPRATYRSTLEFLDVDPEYEPELAVINPNKVVRSRTLQQLLYATGTRWHASIRPLDSACCPTKDPQDECEDRAAPRGRRVDQGTPTTSIRRRRESA